MVIPSVIPGGVTVFRSSDVHGCYRIPSIIRTRHKTLLAFAERRDRHCSDDTAHEIVLRRSLDNGQTWGDSITVVGYLAGLQSSPPCDGCPQAASNPNPVEIRLSNGSTAILLHYETLNNPQADRHGLDMQLWSTDEGLTWHNLSPLQFLSQPNIGAMIGPSVGLQAPSGAIYFTAHLAYGYWDVGEYQGRLDHEGDHCLGRLCKGGSGDGGSNATTKPSAWLYGSSDQGMTWHSSRQLEGLDECSIAWLVSPRDGRIIASCRLERSQRRRAQVVWSAGGQPEAITYPEGLIDPGCQGSILNVRGTLYLSHLSSTDDRSHMTVRRSFDRGASWADTTLVWEGPSGYSQLVDLSDSQLDGLSGGTADGDDDEMGTSLGSHQVGQSAEAGQSDGEHGSAGDASAEIGILFEAGAMRASYAETITFLRVPLAAPPSHWPAASITQGMVSLCLCCAALLTRYCCWVRRGSPQPAAWPPPRALTMISTSRGEAFTEMSRSSE